MNKIILYELVQQSNAETIELGDKVYAILKPQIEQYLNKGEQFVVDFTDINIVTTAFLNNAIGKLFFDLNHNDLIRKMSFSGMSNVQKDSLKWSIANALKKAGIRQ